MFFWCQQKFVENVWSKNKNGEKILHLWDMVMICHELKCYPMNENIHDFYLSGIIGCYIHGPWSINQGYIMGGFLYDFFFMINSDDKKFSIRNYNL